MIFSLKHIIIFIIVSFSLEQCHSSCDTCFNGAYEDTNMQCKTCIDGLYLIFNTTNCVNQNWYKNFFLNNSILYPCSIYHDKNCYECDPYSPSINGGICLSCNQGYTYNKETKECEKCKETEYSIIINDFDGCQISEFEYFCDKYITYCKNYSENITCPDEAPFFNKLTKSCQEKECLDKELQDGTCIVKNKKYKDRILFINWFDNNPKYVRYPSYNVDKSGNLLIELTCELSFEPSTLSYFKNKIRKFYFYDKDGRGLFNEVEDEFERTINTRKKSTRFLSTSIALKNIYSGEYNYLLNLEGMDYNMEFIDLKTFEITKESFFDVSSFYGFTPESIYVPSILFLELNEKNQYLMAMYIEIIVSNNYDKKLYLMFFLFNIDESNGEKIDVNSFNFDISNYIGGDFNLQNQFSLIQTKKGYLILAVQLQNYQIVLGKGELLKQNFKFYRFDFLYLWAFIKLIYLKDEICLLCYNSPKNKPNKLKVYILDFENGDSEKKYMIFYFDFSFDLFEKAYWFNSDIIRFSENRAIFVVQKYHGARISIFLIDFFDNYSNYIINKFLININKNKMVIGNVYSLLFKYKEILGFQIETITGENGFVLFGYYNSTDPKQILNLKTDGLNYAINLGSYLNLQSNIFGYEIRYIKIVEIPPIESGLYLISNKTHMVKIEDCVNPNTEISLFFSKNGILKKGNYFFKFVGVVQEPPFEKIKEYADDTFSSIEEDKLDNYIEIFNEKRNINITGKLALVQINVLNDTKIFCDKKYDETAIKSNNDEILTCGNGKFYDVKNENEITQLNLGINYYFDINNDVYIKCHKRCKTCSREYNDTYMNCDECYDNFFLRDNLCLEISKCEYNYYYDINFNINCVDRGNSCPDFKPDEDKKTKECIKKCNIDDYKNKCNPTNNIISIKETYKQILENTHYLNLEDILFNKKEKYSIIGNNVSFIFTTSEKEKEELLDNFNSSTILLNECENILKKKYSININTSLPILKIEVLNNYSHYTSVNYEIFNPFNLSQKLDLNLCKNKFIEIRLPIQFNEYKLDLITKTKDLGYNIFDSNDSFYHDICSVFSYNNCDISLSERKRILDLSDENFCMSTCNYSTIDIITLRSICLCKIYDNNNNNSYESNINKNSNNKNSDNDNNLSDFFKKSIDISKSSNIKIILCIQKIFNLKIFTNNYGFYIVFLMNIFDIIILILSPLSKIENMLNKYCSSILLQMKKVYKTIESTENKILVKNEINKKKFKNFADIKNYFDDENNNTDLIENFDDKNNITDDKNNNNKISKNNQCLILKDKTQKKKIEKFSQKKDEKPDSSYRKMNTPEIIVNNLNMNTIGNNIDPQIIKNDEKKNQKIFEELKKKDNSEYYIYFLIKNFKYKSRIHYLCESEIQNLDYKYALQIDNRNNGDYYFALLKENNKVISIFLNKDDYNIQAIKVSLLIFNFNLSLTINALFFDDEAIHRINQDEGSFNLNTQISIVLYSTLISIVISTIIGHLALTQKSILSLRNKKDIKEVEKIIPELVKKLKFYYGIFFGSTIILNAVFWYFITAFCSIYSIIQTHMISDSLLSFLLSISYSILLSLISSIIRVTALKRQSKVRHFLYTLSWIISLV